MQKFPAGDVHATFDYLRDPPTDDASIPLCYYTEDRSKTTMRVEPVQMAIADGRSQIDSFSLDRQGFALIPHRSTITNFVDLPTASHHYPDETAEFVRAITGAAVAFGYGYGVRFGRAKNDYDKMNDDQPARFPHADFTDESSKATLERIGMDIGDYARCALYNVWRVFSDPPQDLPLALCDARTVSRMDEVAAEAIIDLPDLEEPIRAMTTVYRPNVAHRWTYFSNMDASEALVFKAWDSDPSKPQRVPHSAFANPFADMDTPSRCSVETRVAAFFNCSPSGLQVIGRCEP